MKKILIGAGMSGLFVFAGFILTVAQRSAAMTLANEEFSMEREIDRNKQELLKGQIVMDDSFFSAEILRSLSETLGYFFVETSESASIAIIDLEGSSDD